MVELLEPCPACGKKAGEVKKSELPSRFPWRVECNACGFRTESVRLPGVAAKLWNDAKPKVETKVRARAKRGE